MIAPVWSCSLAMLGLSVVRALQFMGGIIGELPWVLGWRVDEVERYLKRAIQADPLTNAWLLLARLLIKQGRVAEAKEHLRAVLETADPHYASVWRRQFKPEAERLLRTLERPSS